MLNLEVCDLKPFHCLPAKLQIMRLHCMIATSYFCCTALLAVCHQADWLYARQNILHTLEQSTFPNPEYMYNI